MTKYKTPLLEVFLHNVTPIDDDLVESDVL